MAGRRKPVFGVISLALMLGLAVAGVLVVIYEPPPAPMRKDESFAVTITAVANIIATLVVITVVSLLSTIFAGISLLRKETRWPAATGLCLSLSALAIVLLAVIKL